jgi:predicted ATPase
MQIRTIRVNNFKSLVDFQIDLAKFTCLVGLNGSGKSTVLQFIDFLAQQLRGDIKGWLAERKWQPKDLKSQLTKKNNIDFQVHLADSSGESAIWTATFNPAELRCTSERVEVGDVFLEASAGEVLVGDTVRRAPGIHTGAGFVQEVNFKYQGSILSQLKESALWEPQVRFREFFLNVASLDLLSPELLRQRTREAGGSLGRGGERLSAFLHELGPHKRQRLIRQLKAAYPQLEGLHAKALRSGWKQLEITEQYEGEKSGFSPRMTTEARHVADGILRLIAILAETQTEHRVLLLDEIENGINTELVEFVLDTLVKAPQQVMVTTHSPTILNYLDDDVARQGVVYLYKTRQGCTRAIRFFDIPSIAEKLTVMGPGEAFADTHLTELHKEIEAVTEGH